MHRLNILETQKNIKVTETKLWLRCGFPDSYLASDDYGSYVYRRNFIRTYLQRDVPQFGPRIPAEILQNLWTMLAHNQGQLLNASNLANSLSTSAPTISTYIDLLANLLLLRRLQPLYVNTQNRLVKSPRIHVRDSGINHALLGIVDYNQLAGYPVYGASWEGYVIDNMLSIAPDDTRASYYRTSAGAEIDLNLEFSNGKTWAIEIKSGITTKLKNGFYNAREDIQPSKSFIIYAGKYHYPLDELTDVVSLTELAHEITAKYY